MIRGRIDVDRVLINGRSATGLVCVGDRLPRRGRHPFGRHVGSAAILMRSGLGPADDLRRFDIEVVADLPVGQRLQDHPFFFNV